MPKSPVEIIESGNLRAEVFQSNGRGVSVELIVGGCGYRLCLFPHELPDLEAVVAQVRESLKVPLLALAKRGSA